MTASTDVSALSHAVAGFGLGIALAGAPGPVQAVILTESVRGGLPRGFRAMAGAGVTFGLLLTSLALGLSVATPSDLVLGILKVAGGLLLLWLAVDGIRSSREDPRDTESRRSLPPWVRGMLAVLLNPGAWLFLGAVASPLFADASRSGGVGAALFAVLGLEFGLALGDGSVVLIGGLGVRRAGDEVRVWVRRGLALVLAGLGVWLIVSGVMSW